MSLYTLENITRTFGRRTVLDIPGLTIEKGKIHALLGANGAGKSTLLGILAFLDRPSAGTISFDGKQVCFKEKELLALRRRVLILDQQPILFSTSVFNNLEFGLKIRKTNRTTRQKRIEEALELVGMTSFINAPATGLSGGERQRVALARVLVLQPEVLLCDEPTAGIDQEAQEEIIQLLRALNQNKRMTILYTTHDQHLADSLAQRTFLLDNGRLVPPKRENVFPVTFKAEANGWHRVTLPNGCTLTMPSETLPENTAITGTVYLDPAKIVPLPTDASADAANIMVGTVQRISADQDAIRLTISCGLSFSVVMNKEDYRRHAILAAEERHFMVLQGGITVETDRTLQKR